MSKRRKWNNLFRPGPNTALNACVGQNGGPADYQRYAEGYFEAGRMVTQSLKQNFLYVDCIVYPLVMLYRHGLEVVLKHLAKILPLLCDEQPEMQPTHELMDNWKTVLHCLEELEQDSDELKRVDQVLRDIVQIDAEGMVFRYPENKQGKRHLQDMSIINVEVFSDGMDHVARLLEGCCYWASEMYQNKCEMMQEELQAQAEMADYYGHEDEY